MEGWHEAKVDLGKYLQVGDEVSEDLYMYFLEVLPPATWRNDLVQIGEPVSSVGGRATWATLYKHNGAWKYGGNCHLGEAVEPQGVAL